MNVLTVVSPGDPRPAAADLDPHRWMGLVLDHFARAEQALGNLTIALDLPITNGSLTSLTELRRRLAQSDSAKAKHLEKRIARWSDNRPFRHLLAHATVTTLFDANRMPVFVTRHLPRDRSDVTPDRVWSEDERRELLRQVSNDSRSICDKVRNLLSDPANLEKLRSA